MNFIIYSSIHPAWNDSFKWSMIPILWPSFVLFCFALSAKWLFWKTTWFLGLEKIFNVTYKVNAIPKHCYAWQLICCHDVIDTNQNFYFLGIGKKPPPVFLWIEVALLNKYLNRKMEINNLFINSEILSTFFKLVGNSTIKKTIFSRMWRKFAFWLFFLFLFVFSSLVCVVPWLTTWIFTLISKHSHCLDCW